MPRGIIAGIQITPQQMVMQWRNKPHQFAVNLYNFEVKLGKAGVEVFQESFSLGRLNTRVSSPWKPRSINSKATHPILNETGTLKNSIKWKRDKTTVEIYTDPKAFGTAARHKGFCYAAVHNDSSGSHTYGKTGVPSIRRQFIGYSTVMYDKIKQLTVELFKGFPK